MGKNNKFQDDYKNEEQLSGDSGEMTLEEARAYRASLHKPAPPSFSDDEKREQFRIFWAQAKAKYGKPKELEKTIWLHLKSAKMDSPEQFEAGLAHFGFKKLRN